jgi:hypothetical protein
MKNKEIEEAKRVMGKSVKWTTILCLAIMLFAFFTGCKQAELAKTDVIVNDANSILSTAKDVLPIATAFLPAPIGAIGNVVVEIGLGLAAAWFGYRKRTYKNALTETVDGINNFKAVDDIGNKDLDEALSVASNSTATKKLVKKVAI